MSDTTDNESLMGRAARVARPAAIALVVLATALVFYQTRTYGMMGFDSYPLILSSRVEGLGDLVSTFTEELTDGLYGGHYYRPMLNLSFAADYGLCRVEPWCYQLTNALLYGATGVLLWALALRLYGGRGGLGAFVALAFFLLHESQVEVVPVPARRPEMLCAMFACASLFAQLAPFQLERRWPILPAMLMMAAAMSKEVGYILPAISVLVVFAYSPAVGTRARAWHAMRAGACHALTIGALFAMRLWVLGGLGGPDTSLKTVGENALDRSGLLLARLFVSDNLSHWAQPLAWLAGLAAVAVALAWIVAARRSGPTDGSHKLPEPARALLIAVAWILLVGGMYGLSRMFQHWYLFLPVVGASLLVGAGVELALLSWRSGRMPGRALAGICLSLLLGFAFFQVRYSPLFHSYSEWRRATVASDEFLAELERRIEATPPGRTVDAPPIPGWMPYLRRGPTVRGVAILEVYSVQAWVELVFPDRELLVLSKPAETPPGPGVSIVRLLSEKKL
jgi:hypothetical protein